jgi:iron complex outermembrane receptor protein
MSELTNTPRRNIRWELLATVSAVALFTSACDIGPAWAADDGNRPTLWIELGAQSEQTNGFSGAVISPFTSEIVADGFMSPIKSQKELSQSIGGQGKISFQPENSDWVFSASALYGRANGGQSTHNQTPGGKRHVSFVTSSGTLHTGSITPNPAVERFAETRTNDSAAHIIADFQAGKDIGLGLFGSGGQSTFGLGVRFAQFTSKQNLTLLADPDFYYPLDIFHKSHFHHTYMASSHIDRSFRGLGPSLSWNASAPVIGNPANGGMALDWGMNAALLFGRQKAQGRHQTVGTYYRTQRVLKYHFTSHIHRSGNPDRSHTVIVPNLGGFAGISFNFSSAKVSLGYRADFFFGAMDDGIDTRKSENASFYGPFATIGIGF